ncbi:MAG TPA: SdpI family protein [Allosphingosinicella sp.]|nr:SdpI family protein [Allosphingosinicella sp.]
MSRKSLAAASLLVLIALLAVALAVGSRLPAELRLPVHWGISGRPDRFSGKWPALLSPAAMTAVVSLFFWFLPALEPRARNLGRSTGLYLWTWAALLAMSVAVELVIVSVALHWNLRVEPIMAAAIGLMLVLIGNQLGKSRSMYMVGIRTPWTLASEEVWIGTHRLGGKMMVMGGLLIIACSVLPLPSGLRAWLFGAVLLLVVAVPLVYSYLLWRRERVQPSE